MANSNISRLHSHPTPSCGASARTSSPRPFSALSSLSTKNGESERAALRKDVLRLYKSEELPSVFEKPEFSFPGYIDVPNDSTEAARDAQVVDWDSGYGKARPNNWPTWKKALNIGCLFLMCIVSPFASSVFAPALADIMVDFDTRDQYMSSFVLSVYVLGYAFGPLFISPLSELFGRMPLYHLCNLVFVLCTWRCGAANSLRDLAILRFFAGVGGSSVFALVPSSIADMIAKEKRGGVVALVAIGYNLGPALSPTIGGYVNDAWGWRWIFYLTAALGGLTTLLSIFCLWETYEPVLRQRKAARLRKKTGNSRLRSRLDVETGRSKLGTVGRAMIMPLRMLLSPSIFLTSLLTAIGYGWIYILYTTLPTTFLIKFHWAPKKIGLAYLGTAAGNLIGMVAGGGLSDAVVKRKAAKGDTRPEVRLLPMIFFWPLVSIGLFIYAWTAHHVTLWIWPLVGTGIFGAGAMSAIFFTGTYIIDAYPSHSASGMAASSILRSLIGGLAPLFSNKLYYKFDVGWAFSLLAFIALAFAPVPWIIYRYGDQWRRKEHFAIAIDAEECAESSVAASREKDELGAKVSELETESV